MGSNLNRETQSSLSPSYILQLMQGNTKTEDGGTPRMAKLPHMAFLFWTSGSNMAYIFKIHLYLYH